MMKLPNVRMRKFYNDIFYYFIQTRIFINEGNLIELSEILNFLKFFNYLIQTHSKLLLSSFFTFLDPSLVILYTAA